LDLIPDSQEGGKALGMQRQTVVARAGVAC
jgi:hypothetical protein